MEIEFAVPYEQTLDGVLGVELRAVAAERVEAKLPLQDEFMTAPGWLQTGVAATVAESLASVGTASAVVPEGNLAMGSWNETTVVAAGSGDVLTAVATRVAAAESQWLWDVRVEDAIGTLVATSRVAIAVRPRPS